MISMKKPKLVDMKESPDSAAPAMDEDSYPYGLRITLDKDDLQKLGMELPEVNTCFMLSASCCVINTHSSANGTGDDSKSFTLQLIAMKLYTPPTKGAEATKKTAEEVLYGG